MSTATHFSASACRRSTAIVETLESREFFSAAPTHVTPVVSSGDMRVVRSAKLAHMAVRSIEVDGNNTRIANGDVIPSASDGTSFGDVSVDGTSSITQTFTIRNNTSKRIRLTNRNRVVITGLNASDFQVVKNPAASIAPGMFTTFTIRYLPTVAGDSSATVTIYNSTASDRKYQFAINGSGLDVQQTTPANGTLFAADSVGNLFTVNTTDGAAQEIGRMPTVMFDIAFSADGTLYGIDAHNALFTIDPATAAVTQIGSLPVNDNLNSLAVASDGSLYTAGRDLYRIDILNNKFYDEGTLGGYVSAGDLAFDGDGRLLLTTTDDQLVQVDPQTGKTSDLGPIGYQQVLGLAADADGTIYGMSNTTDQLFSIDPVTGQGGMAITFQDGYGVYGAAIQPA